ncbi:MAG: DedA family protein [Candidatus Tectomicrobia bacterium]|uniref:DedA family protein n=1 Tax=Tectimicrobiota bacterium TaxID=2528274 RepID=A0A932M049_UNCTE|nr:DedA family protein [Candidatus Tectomicrobia bacterium]
MSIELLLDSFVRHGYWILFGAILLDNAGLPLPGELFLMTFGALARMGQVDPVSGLLVAWLAALIGDSIGYWMGRLGGHGLLKLYCRLTLGSGDCMENALDFYRRRGPAAVILGRFIVGVRGFLFPLAGSARGSPDLGRRVPIHWVQRGVAAARFSSPVSGRFQDPGRSSRRRPPRFPVHKTLPAPAPRAGPPASGDGTAGRGAPGLSGCAGGRRLLSAR